MHMENLSSSDPSPHAVQEISGSKHSKDGPRWYFSKEEIEEYSPSKQDGIDSKKETRIRKSYCRLLQELGKRLRVLQFTIATAITFCHRFFLWQSHAKNDRRIIATACMFLAGKVDDCPCPLESVILASYEIINKKDPTAAQRIRQKEVHERQKRLILLGERAVLATLDYDLNVHHPYKPLGEAIRKFKLGHNAVAQVAWNFINDGLLTTLCLQFKPQQIAAGALYLAARILDVELPSNGEKLWWQELDVVSPRQLDEVSDQMIDLYEPHVMLPSSTRTSAIAPTHSEERAVTDIQSLGAGNDCEPSRTTQNRSTVNMCTDTGGPSNQKTGSESNVRQEMESSDSREGAFCKSLEAMKKIDMDKVKAALEKRRKSLGIMTPKPEPMDEDELIEWELEAGIEMAESSEKINHEQWLSWLKSPDEREHEDVHQEKHHGDDRDEHGQWPGQLPFDPNSSISSVNEHCQQTGQLTFDPKSSISQFNEHCQQTGQLPYDLNSSISQVNEQCQQTGQLRFDPNSSISQVNEQCQQTGQLPFDPNSSISQVNEHCQQTGQLPFDLNSSILQVNEHCQQTGQLPFNLNSSISPVDEHCHRTGQLPFDLNSSISFSPVDERCQRTGQLPFDLNASISPVDDIGYKYQSPKSNSPKRKAGSSEEG